MLKPVALMVLLAIMSSQMSALATCIIPHNPGADHCKPDCPMMQTAGHAAHTLSPKPANHAPCRHTLSPSQLSDQATITLRNADLCVSQLPALPAPATPVSGHPVNPPAVSPPMTALSLQALHCSFLI
jgi:hypothetical protein